MEISYDDRTDLLYLRFDERKQEVENKRVTDDVVLDIGAGGKIIGIEILDASLHLARIIHEHFCCNRQCLGERRGARG